MACCPKLLSLYANGITTLYATVLVALAGKFFALLEIGRLTDLQYWECKHGDT